MSAVVALLRRDGGPADPAALDAMLLAAPYRGPDGLLAWTSGSVGLGHARMAVTPEDELETQPLVSPRTGCVLVADARLDNRAELIALLGPAAPCGDGELILRAYEAWGVDGAARLLGDFAFALWDPRHRRLVCARDPSGQRALFYRADGRVFAAASEIQQLLQDPSVPVAPNEERIRDFLVPLNMARNEKDGPATFYRGIQALPAAHALIVDRQGLSVRRYWELEPPAELRYRSDQEYAEHFRALLFEAVAARLRSSHPVGALLSGGLDSSSVVAVAQELRRSGRASHPGLTSFTAVFDGLECDERELVRDLAERHDFEARYLAAPALGGRLRPEPTGFLEAPNMGVSDLRDRLAGAASRAGVRALLTGDVADACVHGSPLVFDSLLRQGRLVALWRHLRTYRRASPERLRTILAMHCLAPLLPLGLHRWLTARYAERVIRDRRERLLPAWMSGRLRDDLLDRHQRLCRAAERARRFSSPARELEYRLLYPPEVSRHPVPWPLELWRPFADRRLHAFLLAIPPEQKSAPLSLDVETYAGAKRLIREGMRALLPESIRARASKTLFSGLLQHEVARQWPLYDQVFGPAGRSEIVGRGYVER
ncbi:MAG TPA: asparagine synthase-related protein, partial [Chloroflexota bacterium]